MIVKLLMGVTAVTLVATYALICSYIYVEPSLPSWLIRPCLAMSAAWARAASVSSGFSFKGGSLASARITLWASTSARTSSGDPGLGAGLWRSLDALRGAATSLRIPRVVARDDEAGLLILEDLGDGARGRSFDDDLGRGLAQLHRATQPRFGFGAFLCRALSDMTFGLHPRSPPYRSRMRARFFPYPIGQNKFLCNV